MKLAEKIFSIPLVKLVWYRLNRTFSSRKFQIPYTRKNPRYMIWGDGSRENTKQPVPKIIWSYWSGKKSACAEACRNTWETHKSDFTILILNSDTIRNFLPDIPQLPDSIPEQKVSNLIRLMLLERYGGIWVDYSTFLTQPLNWVIDLIEKNNCEVLAFYNEFPDEYKTNHERPIIENGFLTAATGSKFISEWRRTYQECILSKNYKEFFRERDDFNILTSNFLRKDKNYIDYFVCYIAAQLVMTRPKPYRLILINAEDEYYYLSYSLNPPRSRRKFCKEMLLRSKRNHGYSRLVKITGRHRKAIDEHIAYGCYRQDSMIGFQLYDSV